METAIAVAAILFGIIGIIGSIVPGIAGPPLSWVGMLLIYLWGGGTDAGGSPLSLTALLVWLGIVTIITIMDYVVPAYFTKMTGGSKKGSWGATVGLLVGMFISPVLMIVLSLAGAFLFELLLADNTPGGSIKAALGTFLGFLFSTGIKFICTAVMMYQIIVYAF
ncbi:MAG: DUF456 domain-containing protein [Bacteroidales bacterium]|nr:DUF456 domain-containing protein [Bacteroidales bacterium]